MPRVIESYWARRVRELWQEKSSDLFTEGYVCPDCNRNALWYLSYSQEDGSYWWECQWCGEEFTTHLLWIDKFERLP